MLWAITKENSIPYRHHKLQVNHISEVFWKETNGLYMNIEQCREQAHSDQPPLSYIVDKRSSMGKSRKMEWSSV